MHPTRARLILTTVDLLDAEQPDRIGQEMVLQASGISKGSMYHHFEDFPDVVEAALVYRFHRVVDANIAAINEALASANSREDFISHVMAITRMTQARERAPFRFERARALGRAGNSERFRMALGVEQKRLTDAMTDVMRRAQAAGWLASDVDPRTVAVFVQAYTLGKVIDDITDEQMDPEAWNHLITRLFDRGLSA